MSMVLKPTLTRLTSCYMNDVGHCIEPKDWLRCCIQGCKERSQKGITLKESCLKLGALSSEEFDQWVRPENMIGPKD